ncbi:MAG: hypothetical protein AB1560_09545 [Pseudomonadota bacterium]
MNKHVSLLLAVIMLAGCATQAATSGRVVIRDDTGVVDIRINDRDREYIHDYYRGGKGLPPGLAKRGGHLPPGLAKRDRLPPGLQGDALPYELERRLSRLPSSYVRVRIGQDIVLMDRNTRVVLDVVYGIGRW